MATVFSLENKFEPAEEITWRDVESELIVLYLPTGEYYTFNEIGKLTWNLLIDNNTIGSILETISNEYDMSFENIKKDVNTFITGLLENNLIKKRRRLNEKKV